MALEICAVGGYGEVGRNMTAVRYEDEVVILDMGLHLDNYIHYTEDEDIHDITGQELLDVGAVPDISKIKMWKKKVKAIIPGHAHLDHIGAVPFLAKEFDAPILLTPYSAAVLNEISTDNKIPIYNKVKVLSNNAVYHLSKNIIIEFISVTHSIPDSVMIAVHTPKGTVLYTGDYKFDDTPTLGAMTNYKKLKQLKNVKVLIMDSLYGGRKGRSPSEKTAHEQLKKVISSNVSKNNGLIVTTFSSQIARLKAIVALGKKMRRKVVFLGRSLAKYTYAAEDVGLVRFSDEVEIVKYSSKVKRRLRKIMKEGKEKYMIVCTGHQAEKKAVLSKMIDKNFYHFTKNDAVIFSCTTIPIEQNIENRRILEEKLTSHGVRIFKDIHASGHASEEEHRMLIEMVKPKIIIPYHCILKRAENVKKEVGKIDKKIDVKILSEGDFLIID
ncbi:MBL fold metallo-hydrolase [Candidatus Woesearchaeota archaeon]|nr:MBL fold metallo-hydrolase [Candidatus Woesearchaeota archaeon]